MTRAITATKSARTGIRTAVLPRVVGLALSVGLGLAVVLPVLPSGTADDGGPGTANTASAAPKVAPKPPPPKTVSKPTAPAPNPHAGKPTRGVVVPADRVFWNPDGSLMVGQFQNGVVLPAGGNGGLFVGETRPFVFGLPGWVGPNGATGYPAPRFYENSVFGGLGGGVTGGTSFSSDGFGRRLTGGNNFGSGMLPGGGMFGFNNSFVQGTGIGLNGSRRLGNGGFLNFNLGQPGPAAGPGGNLNGRIARGNGALGFNITGFQAAERGNAFLMPVVPGPAIIGGQPRGGMFNLAPGGFGNGWGYVAPPQANPAFVPGGGFGGIGLGGGQGAGIGGFPAAAGAPAFNDPFAAAGSNSGRGPAVGEAIPAFGNAAPGAATQTAPRNLPPETAPRNRASVMPYLQAMWRADATAGFVGALTAKQKEQLFASTYALMDEMLADLKPVKLPDGATLHLVRANSLVYHTPDNKASHGWLLGQEMPDIFGMVAVQLYRLAQTPKN